MKRPGPWQAPLLSLLVWSIVLVVIFPLIWMVADLDQAADRAVPHPADILPESITFEHYRDAVRGDAVPQLFRATR